MRKYIYILLVSLIFFSFQSKMLKSNILGEWEVNQIKTENMQVEVPNNSKNISLSTSYIFCFVACATKLKRQSGFIYSFKKYNPANKKIDEKRLQIIRIPA